MDLDVDVVADIEYETASATSEMSSSPEPSSSLTSDHQSTSDQDEDDINNDVHDKLLSSATDTNNYGLLEVFTPPSLPLPDILPYNLQYSKYRPNMIYDGKEYRIPSVVAAAVVFMDVVVASCPEAYAEKDEERASEGNIGDSISIEDDDNETEEDETLLASLGWKHAEMAKWDAAEALTTLFSCATSPPAPLVGPTSKLAPTPSTLAVPQDLLLQSVSALKFTPTSATPASLPTPTPTPAFVQKNPTSATFSSTATQSVAPLPLDRYQFKALYKAFLEKYHEQGVKQDQHITKPRVKPSVAIAPATPQPSSSNFIQQSHIAGSHPPPTLPPFTASITSPIPPAPTFLNPLNKWLNLPQPIAPAPSSPSPSTPTSSQNSQINAITPVSGPATGSSVGTVRRQRVSQCTIGDHLIKFEGGPIYQGMAVDTLRLFDIARELGGLHKVSILSNRKITHACFHKK
jgi:hypothetical protein